MSRFAFRATVVVVLLLAAAATWWVVGRGEAVAGGRVTLTWSGSREGAVVLPGQIAWCPITRVGTLEAISNDTGLIVTLLELDSLSVGPHHVVSATIREESPRPSAVAAMRWVSDSGQLVGFRSVSGVIDVEGLRAGAEGSFEIRMRAPTGFDTLVVRGDFTGLPVTAGAVGCP